MVDTRVDHHEAETVLVAQEIDARASAHEMLDLLARHLLGRYAHPFGDDAVVGGKEYVARVAQLGRECLLDEPYLQGQALEHPERALGLGEVVDLVYEGRLDGAVGAMYVETFHLMCNGIPEIMR